MIKIELESINDLENNSYIKSATPISKGKSGDQKYHIQAVDGGEYFLRTYDLKRHRRKKEEFRILKNLCALGFPVAKPLEIDKCSDGAYTLTKWIDGVSMHELIFKLEEEQQYSFGVRASKILRQMHAMKYNGTDDRYIAPKHMGRLLEKNKKQYEEANIPIKGMEEILAYVEETKHICEKRTKVRLIHGDYHWGNLMIAEGKLFVVDFEAHTYADPYCDFQMLVEFLLSDRSFCAIGYIHGYFDGREIEEDFFSLLSLYTGVYLTSKFSWVQKGFYASEKLEELYAYYLDHFIAPKAERPAWYIEKQDVQKKFV